MVARRDGSEAYERALTKERLQSIRQLAKFRIIAVSLMLALLVAAELWVPGWIGPMETVAVYWVLALVLYVGIRSSKSTWIARVNTLSLPLVDMPMLFLAYISNMLALHAAGFGDEVAAFGRSGGMFYVLFVFLASFSLSARQTYIAAAVAAVCECLIMYFSAPDPIFMLITAVAMGLAATLGNLASRRSLRLVDAVTSEEIRRERLGRYFPPQVAEHIETSGESLSAGENREVTILFCDIRDFTSLSEDLDSQTVVSLLNDFHTRMVDRIFANGGTLDKFIGDGIMAYFGAPVPQSDHAERAVRCGLAMQQAIADLNEQRLSSGEPPLRMGIGIHTGVVILGDIGAPTRRDFTAIGGPVNVAARMEELTKERGVPILISEDTRQRLGSRFRVTPSAPAKLRGLRGEIACYVPED